jgi:UDP-N-acetylglucosamine--N-acetylmuramyl-(pentapeptide) pyrophosphoryl-undecaprenol N-acetylglucosamine transferase
MSRPERRPIILIAGGGTGGHVFPALAVADALRAIADVDIVFVGTPRGLESRVIPTHGYPLELLDVTPMKGGGPARAVKGAVVAARETIRALGLVRRFRPRAVLSVGGYAAGPVSLAAALLQVKLAVLEPNSVIGFANRLLAPFAARGYLAWSEAGVAFRKGRARVVGVPLRAGFLPQSYAATAGSARVLVMGGSQGAQALNERMPAAIARAKQAVPTLQAVHQSGRDRDATVRSAYTAEGVSGVEVTPFLDDVPAAIARADVIVARAGAVTVAEIAAVGRASILVPFPHAADDHQAKNAESLAADGGAVAVRQEAADVKRIADELVRLLGDHALRGRMAAAARAHGKPQAAMDIARDLLDLAGIPLAKPTPPPKPRHVNGAPTPPSSPEVR